MSNFKQMYQLVDFVYEEIKTSAKAAKATSNDLTDEEYRLKQSPKKDIVLREFEDKFKHKYGTVEVSEIYNAAVLQEFISTRKAFNNEGIVTFLEAKGVNFVKTGNKLRLKWGKWREIAHYYYPWTIGVSVAALILALIGLFTG